MAGVGSSEFDCPVCFNLFTSPKLLPCYHLVCQSCVLSWMERTGGRGKCPVCRAPILSGPRTGSQLQTEVNSLPTDFATQALAESHSILSGPHQCGICTNNVAAQDFCLQCSLKLCLACTTYHQKLPATSDHTVQQLNTLTVRQLTARHQVKCQTHTHELAQLYCTSHSKLVCFRCGATTHRACLKLREVEDVAKEERRKLQDLLEWLKVKERNLAQQVDDTRDHFKAMRLAAQNTFDEKRRRDDLDRIQSEEDAMKASLEKMENARVSTALPIRNISNLVLECPDDGLLEIHQNLVSRLDNLESQMDLAFRNLRSDLAQLGQRQSQVGPTTAAGATATTSATASGQRQSQVRSTTTTTTTGATTTTSATASGQIQQPTSGPAAGATATTSATASGHRQSQVGPTTAAGATAMTSATASGQIQQPTSGPAAGATATTSTTASGHRQSQVGPTTAAGATATTSATASGQRQSQVRSTTTTTEATTTTSATASGQRQSQVRSTTTTTEATTTTSATASGQRQSQVRSTITTGATTTTSATASVQRQSQVRSTTTTTTTGATTTTSATASGQIQQPTSGPAAGATATTSTTASGQRQSQARSTTTTTAGATATTSATASGQIQQPTSGPAAGATATTSATASGQIQQPTSGPAAGATATTSATASGQRQSQARSTTTTGATTTTSPAASGPTTAPKLQGAALARVLRIDDRVKLAPGVLNPGIQPGDKGTVTAIPSRRRTPWGVDPKGCVDVKWDSGGEDWHRMGWNNKYDLILA